MPHGTAVDSSSEIRRQVAQAGILLGPGLAQLSSSAYGEVLHQAETLSIQEYTYSLVFCDHSQKEMPCLAN